MIPKLHILDDDHFRDHCGVFGIVGHPEAAKLTYLGLYALQHRGQESSGIASSDGAELHFHKSLGLVQEIFTPEVLSHLPGSLAIGHTRYSTAGENTVINAQPVVIDCNKGKIALGHNGNLTNALEVRRRLEHRGSIFQTTSDTEVIVHLIARSTARNLAGAIADALSQVEGAYSLLLLTRDEMFAIRDPRGFRPAGSRAPRWRLGRSLRNLRVRPDRRGIRPRSRTRRNGAHFARGCRIHSLRR